MLINGSARLWMIKTVTSENPRLSVTLVQLSDIHLGPLPWIAPPLLNAKRLAGALNWWRKRRFVHKPEIAARIAADAVLLGAAHIAVTGDLANIGLPSEIERARMWLQRLGPPDRVSAMPGNHDIYSTVAGQRLGTALVAPWAAHFASCAEGSTLGGEAAGFPFVRIIGAGALRVALIGLNSAVETPPLVATGRLGSQQLSQLAQCLAATGRAGLVRVVMLHHPPLPGLADRHHELVDAAALADVLGQHGADLVIHGHNHRRMINAIDGPHGTINCVGVPSGSVATADYGDHLARSHSYQFSRDASGGPLQITLIARGIEDADGPVVELERVVLVGG